MCKSNKINQMYIHSLEAVYVHLVDLIAFVLCDPGLR